MGLRYDAAHVHETTGAERTEVFRNALLRYCGQDTLGLVRIVHFMSGHDPVTL